MSNAYFSSLSGMIAASLGLQNASHNISNLQSPGFKRSDVFYSSLKAHQSLGSGVVVDGNRTSFSAGNYLETANPSDLAIVGQGYFIVRLKNGLLRYTRDGEFEFNEAGVLIDKHSKGAVQGYNAHHQLAPILQKGPSSMPGRATHHVQLSGEFIIQPKSENELKDEISPLVSINHPIEFKLNDIYDQKGKPHSITLRFESKTLPNPYKKEDNHSIPVMDDSYSLIWELSHVTCDGVAIDFNPQSIEFDGKTNGKVKENANSIELRLHGDQALHLAFGEPQHDKNESVRLFPKDMLTSHNETQVSIKKQDGRAVGYQTGFSFDEEGRIAYHYDNEETFYGHHVALARFEDENHGLIADGQNLFRAHEHAKYSIGRANHQGFGSIQTKKIESSNVDSTVEFGHIVVLQRMFQACSQMMEIDKELLRELTK